MLKAGHVLRPGALTGCDPAVGVGTCRAAARAWIAPAGAATVSPGVFRAVCGEGRRYLSGRLRAAGRPGGWVRDSAGHDLLLIGRPSSASAHDRVLLQPQHRAPRVSPCRSPLARDKPGGLAVIGVALGRVTAGRGEWRPGAGAACRRRHLAGRHTAVVGLRTGAGAPRTGVWLAPLPGLGTGRPGGLRNLAEGQITVAPAPQWPERWAEIAGAGHWPPVAGAGWAAIRAWPGAAR